LPSSLEPWKKRLPLPSFTALRRPIAGMIDAAPPLTARGNRDLQMICEQQLDSFLSFYLQEHTSGRHLLLVLAKDEWAKKEIAPPEGIQKSSSCEAINTRGLEQLLYVFQWLTTQTAQALPKEHAAWGDLAAIDGSLIDAVRSMAWADYRQDAKKAKVHLGFDLNHSIPAKIFLTDGKGDERPFVKQILSSGQTGVMDRYYQCHKNFDRWQETGKHFVCRIKAGTRKTCLADFSGVAAPLRLCEAVPYPLRVRLFSGLCRICRDEAGGQGPCGYGGTICQTGTSGAYQPGRHGH
jgi:hypothetical protein